MKTQTQTQKFYGVQAVLENGKRALSFKEKDGKLYFAIGKVGGIYLPTPPPALFLTKKDAQKAIDKNRAGETKKQRMRKLKRMFNNVIECDHAEIVKLKLLLN